MLFLGIIDLVFVGVKTLLKKFDLLYLFYDVTDLL